jgi:hypothetical protein
MNRRWEELDDVPYGGSRMAFNQAAAVANDFPRKRASHLQTLSKPRTAKPSLKEWSVGLRDFPASEARPLRSNSRKIDRGLSETCFPAKLNTSHEAAKTLPY